MASAQVLKLALFLILRTWYALTVQIGVWCVRRRLMWLFSWQCRLMTSCRLVAEAIVTARKLRDAPNNGDSARHGVDVAAHVLDVTRSGAASAGAAKARHARAGAPLVVRVVLLALLYALGWRPKPPGGMGAGAPHKDQMTNGSA